MAHIKKLPSGNYRVQVRLTGLQPIFRTFSTKKLATAFARELEGDTELARKLGAPVGLCPTFRELVELYQAQDDGRDTCTDQRLRYWVERFGDTKVVKIDEHMVDDGLIALTKKKGRGGRLMSGSTINRYKSTLSAVFIYFIQHPDYKRLGFTNPVRRSR